MLFFKKISAEDKILYKNIKEKIGIKPNNISYYRKALTYASLSKNEKTKTKENERMEFLGDAILSLLVTEELYKFFPNFTEGNLSVIRSELVSRKTLNNFGNYYHLNDLILGKNKENIISQGINISGNTFEALIAAIYLDKGHKYCSKFLKETIKNFFPNIETDFVTNDYKSKLLKYSQQNKKEIEFYTNENKEANEKKSHFLCEIYLSKKFVSAGKGEKKRDAEQIAAQKAIYYIENNLL